MALRLQQTKPAKIRMKNEWSPEKVDYFVKGAPPPPNQKPTYATVRLDHGPNTTVRGLNGVPSPDTLHQRRHLGAVA